MARCPVDQRRPGDGTNGNGDGHDAGGTGVPGPPLATPDAGMHGVDGSGRQPYGEVVVGQQAPQPLLYVDHVASGVRGAWTA